MIFFHSFALQFANERTSPEFYCKMSNDFIHCIYYVFVVGIHKESYWRNFIPYIYLRICRYVNYLAEIQGFYIRHANISANYNMIES